MLSIQYIREHPEDVRAMLARRHVPAPIDDILALDVAHREKTHAWETLQADSNAASKRIGQTKDPEERKALIAEQQGARERINVIKKDADELGEKLHRLLLEVPNVVLPEVPDGPDESANVVREQEGAIRDFAFEPKPHWEIGEALGIIDFDAGVKISGSRFYVLKGLGSRLQRALIQFMLDLHVHEHGLEEIYPPFMVKEECFWATGDLPKFSDNIYRDAEDDLSMVTTAEVPLTNIWRDEIIAPGTLPLHYVAYTACFRREKMSAGRDVRGMKRGHQFDKVEMFTYCEPERSTEEFELMVDRAREVCRRLGLPHRVLQLCTGDLGFKAGITYDIEVWAPGQQEWLEVSSVSNVLDFQARRANIRFRREAGGRTEYPHMLNGSGLALPRVVIGILENNQQGDGSVLVPEVLQPYMRAEVIR
jgi:seryl-tRNA synthetase